MARINIENEFWDDPRFKTLTKLFAKEGHQFPECVAIGVIISLWKLAQNYVTDEGAVIPEEIFDLIEAKPKLIEAKLSKRKQDGYFVEGSKKHLAWLSKKRQNGSKGGSVKSEDRKKTLVQYRSKTEANESKTEANESKTEAYILHPTFSNKETTTTTKKQIDECWDTWNETLKNYHIKSKNISIADERILQQAISRLGIERTKNALIGKRYETKQPNYDPASTLSLEYCLSRNNKTGNSNHERLENLALANFSKNLKHDTHAEAEHIAIHGRPST